MDTDWLNEVDLRDWARASDCSALSDGGMKTLQRLLCLAASHGC